MEHERGIPGEFVRFINCAEILRSAGLQLGMWANDIAFTDAAYGEDWALQTADRMVCLSELLYVMYLAHEDVLSGWVESLPKDMIGQLSINPYYKRSAEKPTPKDVGDSDRDGGMSDSIDDLPF